MNATAKLCVAQASRDNADVQLSISCAWCARVKNRVTGSWEPFSRAASFASLSSHGICPQCASAVFAELRRSK